MTPGPDALDGEPRSVLALSVVTVVALLRKAGAQGLDEALVRADIAAGAPVNPDGTLNLVAYAAWLVRELTRRNVHAS